MNDKIVPSSKSSLYRPTSFDRLLHSSLKKVQRWDDPFTARVKDLEQSLMETSELLNLVGSLIGCLPTGKQLLEETEQAQITLCQIPSIVIDEFINLEREIELPLWRTHLDIICQHHFLHSIRRYIWATDRLLEDQLLVEPGKRKEALLRLRDLYHNTYYRSFNESYKVDAFGMDKLLDSSPINGVEWIEWKLELRVFEILKELRNKSWFQEKGLLKWFYEEQEVAITQVDLPKQPIGNEIAMHIDLIWLSHAIFHTQLFIASLISVIVRNWYIRSELIAAKLQSVLANPLIGEMGWQKAITSVSIGLEFYEPEKYTAVIERLKQIIS